MFDSFSIISSFYCWKELGIRGSPCPDLYMEKRETQKMWLVKLNNNDCILCPASFKKKSQSSIINYPPIVHVHTSVQFPVCIIISPFYSYKSRSMVPPSYNLVYIPIWLHEISEHNPSSPRLFPPNCAKQRLMSRHCPCFKATNLPGKKEPNPPRSAVRTVAIAAVGLQCTRPPAAMHWTSPRLSSRHGTLGMKLWSVGGFFGKKWWKLTEFYLRFGEFYRGNIWKH